MKTRDDTPRAALKPIRLKFKKLERGGWRAESPIGPYYVGETGSWFLDSRGADTIRDGFSPANAKRACQTHMAQTARRCFQQ